MPRTALLAALTVVATLTSTPATAAETRYVALGDSYVAGAFTGKPVGYPLLCLRTDGNYPSAVARALKPAAFKDVSCSDAETTDMTQPQRMPLGISSNPPQLDSLTADTSLVTLQIGGNDAKLLDVFAICGVLSATDVRGAPCTKHFTPGGVDQIQQRIDAIAPKVAGVLQEIRRRSPQARVAVVGYLPALPAEEGCWPALPVARGDIPYLDAKLAAINQVLAQEAKAAGAVYVDLWVRGHDTCKPPTVRWVEPVIPGNPATPLHPQRGRDEGGRAAGPRRARLMIAGWALLGALITVHEYQH